MLPYPALPILIIGVVFTVLRRPIGGGIKRWRMGAMGLIALYLVLALSYVARPLYWDHVEPEVTVIAQQVLHGYMAYHPIEAAERYAVVYGPVTYLALVPFLAMGGDPILMTKIAGGLYATLAIALTGVMVGRIDGRTLGWLAAGGSVLGALCFEHYSYWNRADPVLWLCVALGVAALALPSRWREVLLSLAMAVAFNAKFFAIAYFVPVLFRLWQSHGWRSVVSVIILLPFGIMIPFVMWPSLFPIANHVQWLVAFSQQPNIFSFDLLIRNLQFAFLWLWFPAILMWQDKRMADIVFGLTIVVAILAVCMLGARKVAGPHYLIPFLPVMVEGTAYLWRSHARSNLDLLQNRFVIGILGVGVVAVFGQIPVIFRLWVIPDHGAAIHDEMFEIEQTYSQYSIQMGLGNSSAQPALWASPWLYMDPTRSYFFDAGSLMEMQAAELPLPSATQRVFIEETFDIWLIPSPGPPFSLMSWYTPQQPLFSETFRQQFETHYQKVESRTYFEVWQARRLLSP